jgi:proline iminopeptidase
MPAAVRPSQRLRWQASIRRVDLHPRLAEVRCPALVCVGRADPQTPVRAAEAIAAALPAGRLQVLPRSGHYPQVEEPEELLRVVTGFLSEDQMPSA